MWIVQLIASVLAFGQPEAFHQRAEFRMPESQPATQSASVQQPVPFYSEISRIRNAYANDESARVMALLELWERDRFRSPEVATAACEESRSPVIIEQVLERVRSVVASATGEEKRLVIGFFYRPAQNLCRKMADPEPLLSLAVESGAWSFIARWDCPQNLKDKYLVRGIRGSRNSQGSQWVVSLAGAISREAIPALREAIGELGKQDPLPAGFTVAVRTLVDFEDTAILPDLESILTRQDIYPSQRETLELYVAKLKHQHSRDALLDIVRTERDDYRLLEWAVKRLLWLKADRKTIYNALSANRRPSKGGQDIAQAVENRLRSYERPNPPVWPFPDSDSLVLDGKELAEYRAGLKQSQNPAEMAPHLNRLSLRSLVTSAPSGD
jgi:hypothetical protein